MDFTDKFYMMCYKCSELQSEFSSVVGKDGIFIPTIDEMVHLIDYEKDKPTTFFNYISRNSIGKGNFDSVEKLLLAFVVREKYYKKWDDEEGEWVTILKPNMDNTIRRYDEQTKQWIDFEC